MKNDERTPRQKSSRLQFRGLLPTGYCLNPNCNSSIAGGLLFCSRDCSEEYAELSQHQKEKK